MNELGGNGLDQNREYFDKPVVCVETSHIRFPKVCPVCGRPSDRTAHIEIAGGGRENYLVKSWDPLYQTLTRRAAIKSRPPSKVLLVPVCSDHHFRHDDSERYRFLCILVDGFAMVFFVFGLMLLGDSLWRGRSPSLVFVANTIFFCVSVLATWYAFRPNALERAVRIVGMNIGSQNTLIRFENDWYRDVFLEENR